MINEHNFKVCDFTSIIVSDGVTIFDGYVELNPDGKLYMHISSDPNNKDPRPWILKHRITDENGKSLVTRSEISGFSYVKTDVIRHFTGTSELLLWWKNEEQRIAEEKARLEAEKQAKKKTKSKSKKEADGRSN